MEAVLPRHRSSSGHRRHDHLRSDDDAWRLGASSDGWNPKDHEVGRDRLNDGSQRIRYDDGYFRIVDKNGYVITYGYGG